MVHLPLGSTRNGKRPVQAADSSSDEDSDDDDLAWRFASEQSHPQPRSPLHMGVCCVEIGDEMVPLKEKEKERNQPWWRFIFCAGTQRPKKVGTRVRGGKYDRSLNLPCAAAV